jgi:hypothetical protein
MTKLRWVWWSASLAVVWVAGAPVARAQYAAPPTTYSVTQINGMFGEPVTMQIYRDGAKAVYDHIQQNGTHTRALYDLSGHTNYSWDMANPQNGCGTATWSGDWGDPFAMSDIDDLIKNGKPLGNETVNGFATKVTEAVDPNSKMKVKIWQETKYGMVIKAELTPPGGAATTVIDTKQFSTAKPDAALFVLPEPCAKAGPPVHVPTSAERFAAATGDDGANFDDATIGPGSANSCGMLLRVVRAGSMQPVTAFQVAVDLAYDIDHPPAYTIGMSDTLHSTFAGGALKEYTAQLQNGVLRLDNVPDHFELELAFGRPGSSSALIYRHCAGPRTVLFYVVKNPDKISDGGDWMWVKSGKFATVAGH